MSGLPQLDHDFWCNKVVVVTGGTGTIGSAVCCALLNTECACVRVLSHDENGIFEMSQQYKEEDRLRWLVGDVRENYRLKHAFDSANVVFHCAALKHVPLCEYNPFEAMKTNVLGTQNVIDVCSDCNVELLVFVSTDKAVHPSSAMGATKLLGERLVTTMNMWHRKLRTVVVRFGNVLGSRGSLLPEIKKKVMNGESIALTHPQMTRFFMSIDSAVHLMLHAASSCEGGEIFVLKMPAMFIRDVIEVARDAFCEKFNRTPPVMLVTGKRVGEKLWEGLMTEEESERAIVSEHFITIYSKDNVPGRTFSSPELFREFLFSNHSKPLSKDRIKCLLSSARLID